MSSYKHKCIDNSKNRLRIKPVMLQYEKDYSHRVKNLNVISMQVEETGETVDYIYSNQKTKVQLQKEEIERRNTDFSTPSVTVS